MLRRLLSWEQSPRIACGTVVTLTAVTGYTFFNRLPVAKRALVPLVPILDDLPVWPWTVVTYAALYPFVALSISLLRDAPAARRAAVAWVTGVTLGYVVFALWPTRIERAPVPSGAFLSWLLEFLRTLDEPHTCFPSLHVTHCVLGLWVAWATRWRWWFFVGSIVITASTLTTDQHYFLDLPSGALVGVLGIALSRGLPYKGSGDARSDRKVEETRS